MQEEDALGDLPLPARLETPMSKSTTSRALVEAPSPQSLNDAALDDAEVRGHPEVILKS